MQYSFILMVIVSYASCLYLVTKCAAADQGINDSGGKSQDAPAAGNSMSGGGGSNNMYQMINSTCDDGKTNLTVDWDKSDFDFKCLEGIYLEPNPFLKTLLEQQEIPPDYSAKHVCMKSQILYNESLPTFGPHRPAWAKYGEYIYLPPQRYLHNMEHGAILFLYHPCVPPSEVNKLKNIVKNCLFRHVISASRRVPRERPFVFMSWGWRMLMPTADVRLAVKFIREHALQGAEKTPKDGYYDLILLDPAKNITTPDDQQLCPRFPVLL